MRATIRRKARAPARASAGRCASATARSCRVHATAARAALVQAALLHLLVSLLVAAEQAAVRRRAAAHAARSPDSLHLEGANFRAATVAGSLGSRGPCRYC